MDNVICIVNYNGTKDTIECLKSLYDVGALESNNVFLLDNGSKEENYSSLIKAVEDFANDCEISIKSYEGISDVSSDDNQRIKLIRSLDNLGFAGGNNLLLNIAISHSYQFCTLLNNDTILKSNTIDTVKKVINQRKDIGASTCNICYFDKPEITWNAGGKIFFGYRFYYKTNKIADLIAKGKTVIKTEFISGCFLMVKTDVLKKYGVLSEKFFFGEEDYEFAWRMKRNHVKCISVISNRIFHKVSSSVKNKNSTDQLTYGMLYWINRYIDTKSKYSYLKWCFWRLITSSMMFLKRITEGKGVRDTYRFIHMINILSERYDGVSKELTEAIWNNNLDKYLTKY